MKPILFNTAMVRAILDGRKTVTRRVVKPQPRGHAALLTSNLLPETTEAGAGAVYAFEDGTVTSPPYRPGDILYVRETWAAWSPTYGTAPEIIYKADGYSQSHKMKWRPSIHMPREAARLFLRVTDVRVERLQAITESEAEKEGLRYFDDICQDEDWHPTYYDPDSGGDPSTVEGFSRLWDTTIKQKDRAIYSWEANPWVWVIEFERISKEEAFANG